MPKPLKQNKTKHKKAKQSKKNSNTEAKRDWTPLEKL